YTGFTLSIGQTTAVDASQGGEIHPILARYDGPDGTAPLITSLQLSDQTYKLKDYNGTWYWADSSPALQASPKEFLIVPQHPVEQELLGDRRDGIASYVAGVGAGMGDAGLGIFDGLKSIGKLGWDSVKYGNVFYI